MGETATTACLLLDLVEVNYGKALKSTRERKREEEGKGNSMWRINGGINAECNADTLTFEFADSFYQRS